jgi:hypothetical protein
MAATLFAARSDGQHSDMPTLADELVLLAITEKGDVASDAWTRLDNGVAGAHLMELALQGRTRLEDERIAVVDSSPTGSAPTDEVLAELARSEERRAPKEWIERLAGTYPHGRVVEDLCGRGILTEQRSRVLGIFKRTRNLEADPGPERAARARLRGMLLEGRVPDPGTPRWRRSSPPRGSWRRSSPTARSGRGPTSGSRSSAAATCCAARSAPRTRRRSTR